MSDQSELSIILTDQSELTWPGPELPSLMEEDVIFQILRGDVGHHEVESAQEVGGRLDRGVIGVAEAILPWAEVVEVWPPHVRVSWWCQVVWTGGGGLLAITGVRAVAPDLIVISIVVILTVLSNDVKTREIRADITTPFIIRHQRVGDQGDLTNVKLFFWRLP